MVLKIPKVHYLAVHCECGITVHDLLLISIIVMKQLQNIS